MAPSFKSPTGLPLAIYIEPSSKNRAASNKAILSNGGAPCPRLSNANVILIDATSHAGRECARQMCADPTKVVLFHEWIEACLSAGKLLGEDLNWGNLRIEDPEMVDESLFVDDDVPVVESKARVKEEEVHAVAERNDRPWPTPTSPTRLPPGELPVYAGEPSGSSRTPPPVKPEIQEPIPGPSHYDPRPSPPRHSRPSNTQTLTPPPQSYGRAPISPTLGNLFRAACEEYEILKKDPETYVFSGLKRKARSIERNSHSVDKPLKSPRVEAPRSSHSSHPGVYEPLAKKLRPPLPAGSTKRGPKRRSDESRTNQFSATPSQPFEIIDLLGSSLSPPPPLPNEKIFTLVGEPVQFWLQVDLPDRGSVIRLLRKHGGLMAPTMEAASYVIVSKAAPQYAEVLIEADTANRVAVPVAWINQCVKSGMMVPVDDYAIPASSIPLNSTLTQEDIIRAAMDDNPPQPSSPYSTAGASGKHAFTSEDLIFMQQYVAWKYARDPSFTTQSVCRELGLVAPHHTIRSWLWFYQRPSNEISRVVTTVKGLLA